MKRYLFYPAADRRQDDIFTYTAETWGEKQAERYIHGLHRHLQSIADRSIPWRALAPHLLGFAQTAPRVYYSRYEKHYILFRELDKNTIGVMTILHTSMDMPVRLAEDFRALEEDEK